MVLLFGAGIIDLCTHVVGESKPCYVLCTTKNSYQQISPTKYRTPCGKQATFFEDENKKTAQEKKTSLKELIDRTFSTPTLFVFNYLLNILLVIIFYTRFYIAIRMAGYISLNIQK